MTFPTIKPRRSYITEHTENDQSFVDNNLQACVWLLENFDAALKAAYKAGMLAGFQEIDDSETLVERKWPDDLAELREHGINED
jgi:hypothetical protein